MDNIGYLYPGRGYLLGFDDDDIGEDYNQAKFQVIDGFNPTAPDPGKGGEAQIASFDQHFEFKARTIDFYPIVIDSLVVEGIEPDIGDEIAVLTPDSLCVGAHIYDGNNTFSFAAWRDDPTTEEIDGWQIGEEMIFAYWDASEEQEYFIELPGYGIASIPPECDDPYIPANAGFGMGFATRRNLEFKIENIAVIPELYALKQNYPNPFNFTTVIEYSLPENSEVKITIYNMIGQEIAVVLDGLESAGFQKVIWEGKNNAGVSLVSGLYFIKMEAEGLNSGEKYSSIKKILYIR